MRILSTYENALPNSQADAEVVVNTAAALARRGLDVTLISPTSPTAPSTPEDVRRFFHVEGPLRIVNSPAPRWSAAISHATRGSELLLDRGRQHVTQVIDLPLSQEAARADVIYTRHIPLALHALRRGHRVFFDHYRPWGNQVPPMQPLIRAMMAHPLFVGMVTHSDVAAKAYRRLGVPESMIEVRHNGFAPERLQPVRTKAEAREELGLPADQPIVVYTGRINHKKGLDIVLEMARALPNVLFMLVGSEGRGVIEEEAETLPNVRVVGWQRFSATAPYLFAADVLIIPPSAAPLTEAGSTVLPLKVYLYLGAGRAIFAGSTPDITEVLRDGDNACLVPPGDVRAAVDALRSLVANPDKLAALSEGASVTAAGLSWDARAEKIERFMRERLAAQHPPMRPVWDRSTWLKECGHWLREGLRTRNWVLSGVLPE